jgi:hypothetical protein
VAPVANRIKITAGETVVYAALNDTQTAQTIFDALPLEARGQTWGDEIYFGIPVDCGGEKPQPTVGVADLGYWEPGSAFCIFFGPTPMSVGDDIVPADPVTVFGKVEGDATVLRAFKGGGKVKVERAD